MWRTPTQFLPNASPGCFYSPPKRCRGLLDKDYAAAALNDDEVWYVRCHMITDRSYYDDHGPFTFNRLKAMYHGNVISHHTHVRPPSNIDPPLDPKLAARGRFCAMIELPPMWLARIGARSEAEETAFRNNKGSEVMDLAFAQLANDDFEDTTDEDAAYLQYVAANSDTSANTKTSVKVCCKCHKTHNSFGNVCSECRPLLKSRGSARACACCGDFFYGYEDACGDCQMKTKVGKLTEAVDGQTSRWRFQRGSHQPPGASVERGRVRSASAQPYSTYTKRMRNFEGPRKDVKLGHLTGKCMPASGY